MKRTLTLALMLLAATTLFAADEPIVRGAAISGDAPVVSLATVIEKPADYSKTPVVVEGVIAASCDKKGCWMQLAPEEGKPGIRVTFKDYGFFIPLDAKGMKARAEGVTVVKTHPKDHADHLEEEGAKLTRNADGSAVETSFVANGVVLTK